MQKEIKDLYANSERLEAEKAALKKDSKAKENSFSNLPNLKLSALLSLTFLWTTGLFGETIPP